MHQCCLRVCATVSQIYLAFMVHLIRKGRGDMQASLQKAHQNFTDHPFMFSFKVLIHYIQATRDYA